MTRNRITAHVAGVFVAAWCVLTTPSAPAATFAELAKFLPDDANAVIVANAAGMYSSPLGVSEGWKERYASHFEATPLLLPPSAVRGVLAAEIDLATLRPEWQTAAMELSVDPTPGDIARKMGGRTDVLASRPAAKLGEHLYVLKFDANLFGVITPADHQQAGRWAEDVRSQRTGRLTPYLEQSIAFADRAGTHVVLAVDLVHAFTEESLRARAAQAEKLGDATPEQAAKIFASIQGVKFGLKVDTKMTGRLQFDFGEEVGPLAAVAKPAILRIVGNAGAMLPEFADWTAESDAHSLALQGTLTEDGMRRILSLLAIDAGALESTTPEPATTAAASPEAAKDAMGKASLRYFRGVSKYVDDIHRLGGAASLDQAVMWIENYGRKVDSLPTRNVDPELIQYGKYVAQTFYSIVDQATGILDQYDASQTPVVTNYNIGFLPTARTVNWGGNFQRMYAPYGNANIDVQATQANMEKSQEQIDAAVKQATTTLNQLISDQQTVKSKLAEKYKLPF
jgi:hypothetical protein